jgi:deoxyribodipyrimidine photolyase-related protein
MDKHINLLFPNQLYAKSPLLENKHPIYIMEEFLFFRQYRFHKQKIAFQRASMQAYADYLKDHDLEVKYIDAQDELADIRKFGEVVKRENISDVHLIRPTDEWLEQRLQKAFVSSKLHYYEDPQFLNSREELSGFFRPEKQRFFQTSFYKEQRRKRNILMEGEDEPAGGKWSFDDENRKKYPKGKTPPPVQYPDRTAHWEEAVVYVEKHFPDNPGKLSKNPLYPVTHAQAEDWFEQFLEQRFHDFGAYEDAIVKGASVLNHSVLSPLLNVGLLVPEAVVKHSLDFARKEKIPLNSTEGFIRQIIGWREFIRGMYIAKGNYARTQNQLGFSNRLPESFYTGTTGIEPIDKTIQKVLETGYCHHIERLMLLGNFMLLCECDPDAVYQWFMELFIDAYDWVMVPNVYGMSQFADGGTFATKPYIGGSNYVKKMSNYSDGPWTKTWDGLFWRFIHKHEEVFANNPRTGVLVHSFKRMNEDTRKGHLKAAEDFLKEQFS